MCQATHMRLHINLDDELVADLDKEVGKRKRSSFITALIREALDERRRWRLIESAHGAIDDHGHVWDPDPAAWVHEQRRSDPRRVG